MIAAMLFGVPGAVLIWPAIWFAGGMIAGGLIYLLFVRQLLGASRRHGWQAVSAITSVVGPVVVLWGGLCGLYFGLDRSNMSARTEAGLDRIAGAIVILSLTWLAARIASDWIGSIGRRADHRVFSVSLYSTIVRIIILVLGGLTVLSSLGIAITPILTTLGLGGLAVALALNDTLSNLFAGVQIVAAKQIRIGDYVKFDFAEGEVADIHWHNTTIRDIQNNLIVIPNSKINTAPFTNYSMCVSDLILAVPAELPWKGSIEQLQQIAQKAASDTIEQVAGKLESEKCTVAITAVNETNIQITANLYVAHVDNRQRAVSGYLSRLHDATQAAGMGQAPVPAAAQVRSFGR